MCETAEIHQSWVTPEASKCLTSKAIILHPGQEMPAHTTGPGREEVIVCLSGTLHLEIGDEKRLLFFGGSAFIPENTMHRLVNLGDENASYVFVVTKKQGRPARNVYRKNDDTPCPSCAQPTGHYRD